MTRTSRVAAALTAMCALALGGEVIVRLLGVIPVEDRIKIQRDSGDYAFVFDAKLGGRPPPLRDELWETPDFSYRLETDSLGFPNREPWPPRVDGIVLGNSLITGPGVGIDGQFSTLLEQHFPGRRLVNLGLAGASPEHQYRIHRAYGRDLGASVVISCLWVASDVDNTANFSRWLRQPVRADDYFRFRTSGGTPPRPTLLRRAREAASRSHLLRAVYHGQRALRDPFTEKVRFTSGPPIYLSIDQQRRLAAGAAKLAEPGLAQDFMLPLERLREDVEEGGGRLLVVLLPSKEEVYGSASFPEVLRTAAEVKMHLEEGGFAVLDLYPTFSSLGTRVAPFFPSDIHLNPFGNELVAQAIADRLSAEGIWR